MKSLVTLLLPHGTSMLIVWDFNEDSAYELLVRIPPIPGIAIH